MPAAGRLRNEAIGNRRRDMRAGRDGLQWPQRDGLKWPHLALVDVLVGCCPMPVWWCRAPVVAEPSP
jgi:hypothetical protein